MKRLKDRGLTPKEAAYTFAIEDARAVAEDPYWIEQMTDVLSEQKAVYRQLAKLHNKLLRESGMDGTELKETR